MAKKTKAVEEVERTLPHNLDAERSVVGAVLVHNDAWELATSIISAGDFYRDAHRRIWNALEKLHAKKSIMDFVTVREELIRAGDIDEVGGPAYVASLADGVPRATNVKHYARIVRDKAMLREIIYAANRTLTAAYEAEETPLEILQRTDRSFLELQQRGSRGGSVLMRDTAAAHFERLEWRAQNRGQLTGLETGFPSINELTNGWQRKDMIIVAARPSIGKTVFAMNSAVAAARTGKRVYVFSYEMRFEQLEDRMLSSLTGVQLTRIQNGALGQPDYSKISDAIEVMHNLPLRINDRSRMRIEDVRLECRLAQREEGLDLVVIDYVQRMPSSIGTKATRNEQITDISRQVKDLAGELDVPILLLSQLKRADSRRSDPRPQLDDLRESGALEQDADDVCFLHRPNHKVSGTTEFIREKARNGPTGTLNLTIDRETVTFTDGGEDLPAPSERPRRRRRSEPDGQPALPETADED